MADIFREVDEDLRREKAQEIWRKYGLYFLAAAIVLVLATAAVVAWREWRQSQLRAEGAQLVAATELAAKDQQKAVESLSAFAGQASDGYAVLARLDEAALRVKQGDTAGAAAVYEKVAADTGVPGTYRDIAVVMLALNTLDTAEPKAMVARLAPITAADNPMRFSALELTALLERKGGDEAKAKEIFRKLGEDVAAPGPLRERAREMLRALGENPADGKGAS